MPTTPLTETVIQFPHEEESNEIRTVLSETEPRGQRTLTSTQLAISHSSGVFHWTMEGRRLYDLSSGVLVANLGHNPPGWWQRVAREMGWSSSILFGEKNSSESSSGGSVPLTSYNAVTPTETRACQCLLEALRATPYGTNFERITWAASGSEAVHKAINIAWTRHPRRPLILASRHGFHGKKGIANALTGSEQSPDRDPRVVFFSFPMEEVADHRAPVNCPLDRYEAELEGLWQKHGSQIGTLITEPYLGAAGSFHPPSSYLQLLERFCKKHDIVFILDEVQSNFGRTGEMFAFETHKITPDLVVLGKGLGNGVPVAAVAGPSPLLGTPGYGELSDTWSANPLSSAAVTATIEMFRDDRVLEHAKHIAPQLANGLDQLKATGVIAAVRGEGFVYGLECRAVGSATAPQVALEIVRQAYLEGIHLLGPLSGKCLRISPPLTITESEWNEAMNMLISACQKAGRTYS